MAAPVWVLIFVFLCTSTRSRSSVSVVTSQPLAETPVTASGSVKVGEASARNHPPPPPAMVGRP